MHIREKWRRIFGKYGAWGALIFTCAVRFPLVVFVSSLVMGLGDAWASFTPEYLLHCTLQETKKEWETSM